MFIYHFLEWLHSKVLIFQKINTQYLNDMLLTNKKEGVS